ncbi:TIGR02996 domain-containing protein [Myxococcus stipitatus]|uniref:TIGR02996 domain-containing protein n=1 Tax=Myxococcus stipitatus TaxID=83455 RepID=UPI0030D088DA
MIDGLEMHLERAEDALARNEGEAALGHLLEAWKECRAEPIIELIHRLSDHLLVGFTPLETSAPRHPEDGARHAMDLPRVMARLMQAPRDGFAVPGVDLDLLRRRFPADPRMLPVVLASARQRGAEALDNLKMHNAVLIYVGAPYDVEPLRELRARLPRDMGREAERLDAVIQRGERWVPPVLGASAQARCDALTEAVEARIAGRARSAMSRDALLARIHEAPRDDDARKVLADVLLEQGDPLGEFIALQFMAEPDEARLESLLKQHRERWEAPLGPGIRPGSTRFERGFPVAVLMKVDEIHNPPAAWGTVERISWEPYYVSSFPRGEPGRMLNAPALRHVKSLMGVPGALVRALKSPGESHLQRLSLRGTGVEGLVETLVALPELRRLDVEVEGGPEFVVQCLESSLASRLEYFEVNRQVMRCNPVTRKWFNGGWGLTLKRNEEAPVTAVIQFTEDAQEMVPLLRAAARFSAQALRMRLCFNGRYESRRDGGQELAAQVARCKAILEGPASAYTRVSWEQT